MWSIRPETDCSVFPPLACLKGRCNLAKRYAQMAVVTVARRRHRLCVMQGPPCLCQDIWPIRTKRGWDISSIQQCHVWASTCYSFLLFIACYLDLSRSGPCVFCLACSAVRGPNQSRSCWIKYMGGKKGVIKKHRHEWDYHSWFHFLSSLPTSQKSRGTIAKVIMRQHGLLMRVNVFAATLLAHIPKWHSCIHIKGNWTCYLWGKGQGFKPQDRYYKWGNNYIAAAGIKGNFSVCQQAVSHCPPPSLQKCQFCESDTSRGDGLSSDLQQILNTEWHKTHKIDFIPFSSYWFSLTPWITWEISCRG